MNKTQLDAAVKLAQSDADLSAHDIDVFIGYGLRHFKPIYASIPQLARIVRHQAINFCGGLDSDALKEIADCGRSKFTIVGEGA